MQSLVKVQETQTTQAGIRKSQASDEVGFAKQGFLLFLFCFDFVFSCWFVCLYVSCSFLSLFYDRLRDGLGRRKTHTIQGEEAEGGRLQSQRPPESQLRWLKFGCLGVGLDGAEAA